MGNSGKLFKIQETYGNATASLLGLYKNFTGTVREPGGKPTRTVWEHYADPQGTLGGISRTEEIPDAGFARILRKFYGEHYAHSITSVREFHDLDGNSAGIILKTHRHVCAKLCGKLSGNPMGNSTETLGLQELYGKSTWTLRELYGKFYGNSAGTLRELYGKVIKMLHGFYGNFTAL